MNALRRLHLPFADYETGTRAIETIKVPDAARLLYVMLASRTPRNPTIWPKDSTWLFMDFECSLDGENWNHAGSLTTHGGEVLDLAGRPMPVRTARFPLPLLPGRQLRGIMTVKNGPLRTQGVVRLMG